VCGGRCSWWRANILDGAHGRPVGRSLAHFQVGLLDLSAPRRPGASLAVALGGTIGYQLIVAVNAASFVVAAILTRLAPISSRHRDHRQQPGAAGAAGWVAVLRDRPFLGFVGVNLGFALLSLSFVIAVPVFLVDVAHLPGWTPGTLLALNAILSALGAAPVVAAITGRRRDHVLFSSQLIIGVGYGCVLPAGLASPGLSHTLALLAAVLVTTTELIQGPAVSAIVNERLATGIADATSPSTR
jgi:Na+/melibiose symporter-like transporter